MSSETLEGGLKVMNFPVIRFEGLFPELSSQLENLALTGLFGQRMPEMKHKTSDKQPGEYTENTLTIRDVHLFCFMKILEGIDSFTRRGHHLRVPFRKD